MKKMMVNFPLEQLMRSGRFPKVSYLFLINFKDSNRRYWSWSSGAPKNNLESTVKQDIPGIICWTLWKTYADITWGEGGKTISSSNIITQVKFYTHNWVASQSMPKIRFIGDVLVDEGLVPKNFKIKGYKPTLIKWLKPALQWKLNVDASYLAGKASGGAVLRDQRGGFVVATSFPLRASLPLESEIRAIIFAIRWAVEEGYEDFQVETDC
ncbi:unnamed protein product [Cuscuta europaea]|uniref:RNase H type-1 domain-containing protein n=1 Tax=Cuscuta europaea TaxID=41803 RepID=A0A9P1E090_CUSEU|nr:unnamed protein product [Cuscuta europaea]